MRKMHTKYDDYKCRIYLFIFVIHQPSKKKSRNHKTCLQNLHLQMLAERVHWNAHSAQIEQFGRDSEI